MNYPKPLKLRRQIAYEGDKGFRCSYDLNHKSNYDIAILWKYKRQYHIKKLANIGGYYFNYCII